MAGNSPRAGRLGLLVPFLGSSMGQPFRSCPSCQCCIGIHQETLLCVNVIAYTVCADLLTHAVLIWGATMLMRLTPCENATCIALTTSPPPPPSPPLTNVLLVIYADCLAGPRVNSSLKNPCSVSLSELMAGCVILVAHAVCLPGAIGQIRLALYMPSSSLELKSRHPCYCKTSSM